MNETRTTGRAARWGKPVAAATLAAAGTALALSPLPAGAAVQTGTFRGDVIVGRDNDDAGNAFIQPAGVAAKQHMEDTDLLTGGPGDDLLIGLKGSDVIDAGSGDDVTIGGVEKFQAPNSDVILGGQGDDINIWAPGDGSDLFSAGPGRDVQIMAPIVLDAAGNPARFWHDGRWLPHVDIDEQPAFRCTIDAVPATQNLGVEYLVRFFANNTLAVTIREKDTERVFCPSPKPGKVNVADLTSKQPTTFVEKPLSAYRGGALGAILQAS